MKLISCVVYFALTGFMCFLFGRFVPKKHFDPNSFPFRTFSFEKDGAIYERIGIKHWQNRLPDMSKILPGLMPTKRISKIPDTQTLQIMICETCVAEFVHWILFLWGLGCFRFFKFNIAVIVYIIYAASNFPFILIQRYNRPRLQKLLIIFRTRECEAACAADSTDIKGSTADQPSENSGEFLSQKS